MNVDFVTDSKALTDTRAQYKTLHTVCQYHRYLINDYTGDAIAAAAALNDYGISTTDGKSEIVEAHKLRDARQNAN